MKKKTNEKQSEGFYVRLTKKEGAALRKVAKGQSISFVIRDALHAVYCC